MENLPPFAQVLQQRKSAGNSPVRRQPFSQSERSVYSAVHSYTLSPLQSAQDKEDSLSREIERLKEQIQLEKENFAALRNSNENLQRQLNEEREASQEFMHLLDDLRSSLAVEQEKNGSLLEQISQLDKFLQTRKILNSSSKQMTERLQQEYDTLLSDYHQSIETISSQSRQLRIQRDRIRELEEQLNENAAEQMRYSKKFNDSMPTHVDIKQDDIFSDFHKHSPSKIEIPKNDEGFDYNDFDDFGKNSPPKIEISRRDDNFNYNEFNEFPQPNFNEFNQNFAKSMPQVEQKQPEMTRLQSVSVGRYSPLKSNQKQAAPFAISSQYEAVAPVKQTRQQHPALNDTIVFGDDDKNYEADYNTDASVEEMKAELTSLCSQKEFIESMMNAAPTKTSTLYQAKKEKQQWEEKYDGIIKSISSLRLRLKRLREL